MIISIIQTKGGTGKTTLANCLAYSKEFAKNFSSIALIELDTQGTLQKWFNTRSETLKKNDIVYFSQILETDPKRIEKSLIPLLKEHQLTILDVAGESTAEVATLYAASLGDIVLIPMRASTNDEGSFEDHILPLIKKLIKIKSEKISNFYIVPTFFHPQASADKIWHYFHEIMPEYVRCLKHFLPQRSIFENFSRNGFTLHDYLKSLTTKDEIHRTKKAISDIEFIAKEIITIKK